MIECVIGRAVGALGYVEAFLLEERPWAKVASRFYSWIIVTRDSEIYVTSVTSWLQPSKAQGCFTCHLVQNKVLHILLISAFVSCISYVSHNGSMDLRKSDENVLVIWERKTSTRVFGPVKENCEESDLVTYIKTNRLRWAGHVIRLEEQNPARRVLVAVVEGRRQRGRPKLRWEDGVKEDARKMGERNWRNAARNRNSWRKIQKKALAQNGLSCNWWWQY